MGSSHELGDTGSSSRHGNVRPSEKDGGGRKREPTMWEVRMGNPHTDPETPAVGPRVGVRPRVTDGGGGKAGDRNENEEDPSTLGPETSAVVYQHETGEMGGGCKDARPGVGTCVRTEREARSGKEERVWNQLDRKMNQSIM